MGAQKKLNWLGLPLYLWAALAVITAAGLASGKMGTDFGSTIFWLTVVGAVLMGIGNQLPIVKDYLGGGPLFLLIIGSFAAWAKIIPEAYVEATNTWMAGINFQAFFLTLLIVSSVMAIDRKVLARSLAGYLPCIFGGLIGAAVLAILVGMIFFRLSIGEILMTYVMPIMGGGSAARLPCAGTGGGSGGGIAGSVRIGFLDLGRVGQGIAGGGFLCPRGLRQVFRGEGGSGEQREGHDENQGQRQQLLLHNRSLL